MYKRDIIQYAYIMLNMYMLQRFVHIDDFSLNMRDINVNVNAFDVNLHTLNEMSLTNQEILYTELQNTR